MIRSFALAFTGLVAIVGVSGAAKAQSSPGYHCSQLIANAEAQRQIPHGLLMAIAITESGNEGQPSPYAMNIAGRSHFAQNANEMAQIISSNWKRGVKSIDVGCMQINLKYHGHKFQNLTDLLNSQTNVEYGADYLVKLAIKRGSWREGVMDYHNKNSPARRRWYGCKVWNNYLRIIHANDGFVQCPKTPTGSSVASIDSIATSPLVIPGYNSGRRTASFAHGSSSPAPNVQTNLRASSSPSLQQSNATTSSASTFQIPTGHPLDGGITSAPAFSLQPPASQLPDSQFDLAQPRQRVMGTIELAEATETLADVTTSADPRASAFRSIQPVNWAERQNAIATDEAPPTTSNSHGGFAHLEPRAE